MCTPVKDADFLEQDAPIRGQNFAVVSFVSPEEILRSKDVFAMGRFFTSIAKDVDSMLTGMSERFADDLLSQGCVRSIRERYSYLWSVDGMQSEYVGFRKEHEAMINSEFSAVNGDFCTSIRGLKIRGVYESEVEARNRIKSIQLKDPLFDVYMMEVGCWCPWNPNPEDVKDSEFNETQLNTLVKKYKENSGERDLMYETRKKDMIGRLDDERDIWMHRNAAEAAEGAAAHALENAEVVEVVDVADKECPV